MPDPAVLDDLLLGERHAIEDVFSEAEAAAAILFKAGAIEQALAAWDVIIPAGHRLDYDVSDRGRDLEFVRLGRRARCLAMFQRGTTSMPRISSATGTAWPARSPAATPVSPMPSTRAR